MPDIYVNSFASPFVVLVGVVVVALVAWIVTRSTDGKH